MRLAWIVGYSLLGSVGAIVLAASFLLFPAKTRRILIPKGFAEHLRATRGRVACECRMITILFCDVKGSTAWPRTWIPKTSG